MSSKNNYRSCCLLLQLQQSQALLFCRIIHRFLNSKSLSINVLPRWWNSVRHSADILADLHTVECEARGVGPELNHSKCENISSDPVTFGEFRSTMSGHLVVNPEIATLLSSPIVSLEWFEGANDIKLLELLRERLDHLHYHNALCLLCNAFSRPNFYTFKASLYVFP